MLGHNLGFCLLVALTASVFARRKLTTALLVALSFHLHLLGDLVGARSPDGYQWPIPYLLPFSDTLQLSWSGQWALNAWPNLLITAGLIVWSIVLALQRGFSPVELISEKADKVVVRTLRLRLCRESKTPP